MGIGGMVGGGIFSVLGLAIAQAGHAAPFAFTLGGCIALLTGLSYARLGLVFQSSGGSELLIVTIKVIILFLFAGIGLFYVRADHLLPVFNRVIPVSSWAPP